MSTACDWPPRQDFGAAALRFGSQGHLGAVLEHLQLATHFLDLALALVGGLGDAAVGLQLGPPHLGLALAAVQLHFLLLGQDALVGPILGHQHAPAGVRLGLLGPCPQAGLLDLDLLALAGQGLVGQVGDVVGVVPDALQ